jgi:hypothetical protein
LRDCCSQIRHTLCSWQRHVRRPGLQRGQKGYVRGKTHLIFSFTSFHFSSSLLQGSALGPCTQVACPDYNCIPDVRIEFDVGEIFVTEAFFRVLKSTIQRLGLVCSFKSCHDSIFTRYNIYENNCRRTWPIQRNLRSPVLCSR